MSQNLCCPTDLPAVSFEYAPTGTLTTIGDLEAYVNTSADSELGVIVVYDIFGLTPQAKQVCDKLSQGGFKVVLPHFWQKGSTGKACVLGKVHHIHCV